MWGSLSEERTGPSFAIAAGPQQRSHIYRGHTHVGIQHSQLSRAQFLVDKCYIQFYMYLYVKYIQGPLSPRLGSADHASTHVAHVTTAA
jgi:3',5'-cyclic AMP phosphodiesterase CpdA